MFVVQRVRELIVRCQADGFGSDSIVTIVRAELDAIDREESEAMESEYQRHLQEERAAGRDPFASAA
jgi:hypothetical protein